MPYAAALALGAAGPAGDWGGGPVRHAAAPAWYAAPLAWYDDAAAAAASAAPWGARHGQGGGLLPLAHAQAPAPPAAAAPPASAFTATYAGEFGHAGAEYGRFRSPEGAATAPDGRIVIADTGNHRIVVLDARGGHVHTFGTHGTGEGQFQSPADVAVDPDGRIVVADRGNGRVKVFHPNYTHAFSFGPAGPGEASRFSSIAGVAVGADGDIVVADFLTPSSRVLAFGSDGAYKYAVGGSSAAFGTLRDVAAAPDGRIAVLDEQIRLFRGEVAMGGGVGHSAYRPSIDIDLYGRVLLSDGSGGGSIRVYDDGLRALYTVVAGALSGARLAVAYDGRIVVADPVNHRVLVLGDVLREHGEAVACEGASGPRGVSAPLGGGGGAIVAYGSGHIAIAGVPGGDCEFVPHGAELRPAGAVLHGSGDSGGRNQYVVADRGGGGRVVVLAYDDRAEEYRAADIDPSGSAGFDAPSGIAADLDGRILVSDSGADAVFVAAEDEGGGWGISRIGSHGSGPGQFDSPGGVAAGPNGTIWVADTGNGRIQVLDGSGRHLRTVDGGGKSGFVEPAALAVDAYGRAVVADGRGGTVLVGAAGAAADRLDIDISGVAVTDGGYFAAADNRSGAVHALSISTSPDGIAEYFTTGTDAGAFSRPAGVAVSPGGRIVVADTGNNRVQVFGPTALHLFSFGGLGSGRLNLDSPAAAAVGANGTIVVADTGNDRVQAFGPLGGHLRTVTGANGTAFSSPAGVAAGPGGRSVYVADTGNDRVVELAVPGYGHVRSLSDGSGGVPLDGPTGVAVDQNGRVYVADTGNERIQVFDGAGNALHSFGGGGQGLSRPHGIAAVEAPPAGCGPPGGGAAVAVTDAGGNGGGSGDGIHWFSPAGEHLCTVGGFGMPLGAAPGAAVGRAAGSAASLVVADTGNNRVDILGADGERVASLYQPDSAGDFTRRLMDVAVNATAGAVLVADADHNRILVFDREGNPVFSAGLKGSGNGSFDRPMGIAAAPAGSPWPGRIAVADAGNDRVQVLDAAGRHVLDAGGGGVLKGPTSVAVDGRGRIIVADTGNSKVVVFEANGTRVAALDGTALGRYRSGSLVGPTDVAVGPGGEIVVADATVGRVHVYGPDGSHTRSFSTRVPGAVLPYMRDVAVDPLGRVFVVDARNHRIEVFTGAGAHMGTIGRHGSAEGEFQRASGLDVGPSGMVAAADVLGARVHYFETPSLHIATIYNGTDPGGAVLQLARPLDAVALPGGLLAVSDNQGHRLLIVDPASGNATAVGRRGAAPGEFDEPFGMTITPDGRIVVADGGNDRIQVLNSSGGHVMSIAGGGWRFEPQRVAFDGAGSIVVSDGRALYAFNSTGSLVWTAAETGLSAGPVAADAAGRTQAVWRKTALLQTVENSIAVYGMFGERERLNVLGEHGGRPIGIAADVAIDLQGRIFVADVYGDRIAVFGAGGAPLYLLGSEGSADGQFREPQGVHIGADGRIVVADTGNRRVQVLGGDGVHAGTFSMRASGDGRLGLPEGLAVDPSSGRHMVADTGNDRVQVFGPGGAYERTFGARGTAHANLASAPGVAAGPGGDIVVADAGNHRVKVFSAYGVHVLTLGGAGGALSFPAAVDAGPDGRIAVADTGNDRVRVFERVAHGDPRGVGTTGPSLGDLGAAPDFDYAPALVIGPAVAGVPGALDSPEGVAVDVRGRIIVADTGNGRVLVFNRTGAHVMTVGGAEGLSQPAGVEADLQGRILVADTGNDRIVAYGPGGALLGSFGSAGVGPGMFDAPHDVAYRVPGGLLAVLDTGNSRVQLFVPGLGSAAADVPAAVSDNATALAGRQAPAADAPAVRGAASVSAAILAADAPALADSAASPAAKLARASPDAPSVAGSASALAGRVAAADDAPAVRGDASSSVTAIAADAPLVADSAASPASKLASPAGSAPSVSGSAASPAGRWRAPSPDAPSVSDSHAFLAGRAAAPSPDAPSVSDSHSLLADRVVAPPPDAPSVSDSHAVLSGEIAVAPPDAPSVSDSAATPAGMLAPPAGSAPAAADGHSALAGRRLAPSPDAPSVSDSHSLLAGRSAASPPDAPSVSDSHTLLIGQETVPSPDAPSVSDSHSAAAGRRIAPSPDAPSVSGSAATLAGMLAPPAGSTPAAADGHSALAGRVVAAPYSSDAPSVSDSAATPAGMLAPPAGSAPAAADGHSALAGRVVAAPSSPDAPAVSDSALASRNDGAAPAGGDDGAPGSADAPVPLDLLAGSAPAVSHDYRLARGSAPSAAGAPHAFAHGAPSVSDSAAAAASFSRQRGDAPSVSDSAAALALGSLHARAADAPSISDSADSLGGGPPPPPPPVHVLPPPAPPPAPDADAPPAGIEPRAPPSGPAPAAPGGSWGGSGGGGGAAGMLAGQWGPPSARGGGQLPSITRVSWDMCGGSADLFVTMWPSRPESYAAAGVGGAEPSAGVPAGVYGAGRPVDWRAGTGLSLVWHVSADGHGSDGAAEARVASGAPSPAYLAAPSLVECAPGSAAAAPGCYTVTDAKAFRMDVCRGSIEFPPGPAPAPPAAAGHAPAPPAAAPDPDPDPEPEPEPVRPPPPAPLVEALYADPGRPAAAPAPDPGRPAAVPAPEPGPLAAAALPGGGADDRSAHLAAAAAAAALAAAAAAAALIRHRRRRAPRRVPRRA